LVSEKLGESCIHLDRDCLLWLQHTILWQGRCCGSFSRFCDFFFVRFIPNLRDSKKFKGSGFEAELWEDKQKEAAALIDRLKSIVNIYTRELVMGRVMQGRWGAVYKWADHWRLYDELVMQHSQLGQEIDFSDLRRQVYGLMAYDAATFLHETLQ
jgi:hypothetical protein